MYVHNTIHVLNYLKTVVTFCVYITMCSRNVTIVMSIQKFLPEDGTISAETCRRKVITNTRILLYMCILLVYQTQFRIKEFRAAFFHLPKKKDIKTGRPSLSAAKI